MAQCALLGALLACAGTPTITHRRSGSSTTLAGLQGKVVVVNFWAEWCKPCIGEVPDIARVADSMGPDVLFLPVYYHPDPRSARLSEWIDAQPAYFRDRVCFASSTFLGNYDLHRIPHTYVYGRDGRLVADYPAAIYGDRLEELRSAIATALERSRPAPP